MPDLGYENEPVEHIKIAVTSFAFNNAEIIHMLKERGEIIKSEKWAKMAEIDSRINQFKDENIKQMVTPCSIFMTFENEEGVNRAINYNESIEADENFAHLGVWLDQFSIQVEKASEPSDIIWENRHFTEGDRLKKKLIVILLMILLLFTSFCMIYLGASFSLKLLRVYPDVACTNLPEYGDEDAM